MTTTNEQPWQPEQHRAYLRMLARVALRSNALLRGKADASDMAQEAVLRACAALEDFRGGTVEEFKAWLRKILASRVVDAERHYGRRKRDAAKERRLLETLDASAMRLDDLIPSPRTSPTQHLAREQQRAWVAESLEALPDEQREALELHYLGDLKVDQCAELMGRTRASVAGLIRRGLKALREQTPQQA